MFASNPRSPKIELSIHEQVLNQSFGLSGTARLSHLTVVEGRGAYVRDSDDNWYLDLHAGPGVMSTGHGHPVVMRALQEQLHTLVHCHDLASPARLELHDRLRQMLRGPSRRTALLNGGAEAVELALRIVRGFTGRKTVVVFSGAFHGKTSGALACCDPEYRRGWWCDAGGVFRVPYAECSYCTTGETHDCRGLECASTVIQEIESNLESVPGAILVEPVQGTAGNIFPARGFLDRLFSYCKDQGILTIADEILTGCGRTGSFTATEHLPTPPDILLLGKGLGSGYPISAVLPLEKIAIDSRVDLIGNSSTSFGGNPLSAAAAVATLLTIETEKLLENSSITGQLFLEGLKELARRHQIVRRVRGCGLMLGFDLDNRGREGIGQRFFEKCLDNGIMIIGTANRVRLNPPLIFGSAQVDEAIEKMDLALANIE